MSSSEQSDTLYPRRAPAEYSGQANLFSAPTIVPQMIWYCRRTQSGARRRKAPGAPQCRLSALLNFVRVRPFCGCNRLTEFCWICPITRQGNKLFWGSGGGYGSARRNGNCNRISVNCFCDKYSRARSFSGDHTVKAWMPFTGCFRIIFS